MTSAYRARDLLLPPNLLSAARLPLAVAFPLAIGDTAAALAVLALAALTDVLDGFLARRLRQASPLGAIVDGIADKVFGVSVLVTLVASELLSPALAVLLATREIGELPLALRVVASRPARDAVADRRANRFGKLATALELAAAVAAIVGASHLELLVASTAGVGVVAAVTYWMRELRASRSESPLVSHDARADARPQATSAYAP
jgi:CDP-diacylglycerol--glycerol-3-phosphate 3-phosphatidyltransferase/cardiolipin synthase